MTFLFKNYESEKQLVILKIAFGRSFKFVCPATCQIIASTLDKFRKRRCTLQWNVNFNVSNETCIFDYHQTILKLLLNF